MSDRYRFTVTLTLADTLDCGPEGLTNRITDALLLLPARIARADITVNGRLLRPAWAGMTPEEQAAHLTGDHAFSADRVLASRSRRHPEQRAGLHRGAHGVMGTDSEPAVWMIPGATDHEHEED